MKKERILLVIIIVLLLVLYSKYVKKQNDIDMALKSSLGNAMSGFALDFNKVSDDNMKQYYYNEAMSNTYLSSQLVEFTTYDSKNESLDVALYNLYKLMQQDKYKSDIMKKSKSIYDNLFILSQNPIDKEATDNIFKLTEEIIQ